MIVREQRNVVADEKQILDWSKGEKVVVTKCWQPWHQAAFHCFIHRVMPEE